MSKSKIEWTDKTWNPITGCTQISPGCANCYAKRMANRLRGRYGYPADDPFRVTFHPDKLGDPAKWKKPCRVFVCSMGDLFHKSVGIFTIDRILNAMMKAPQHTYILLTKRPKNARKLCFDAEFWKPGTIRSLLPNLYLGVTVESNEQIGRVDELLKLRKYAKVLFVSAEPLLGELDFKKTKKWKTGGNFDYTPLGNLKGTPYFTYGERGIDWVIAGGESGPGARPSHPDWFRKIRDDCAAAGTPLFFKQWGAWKPIDQPWKNIKPMCGLLDNSERWLNLAGGSGFHGKEVWRMRRVGKKRAGNLLDGEKHEEWPE